MLHLRPSLVSTLCTLLVATTLIGCSAGPSKSTIEAHNNASIIGGTEVAEDALLQKSIVGIFNLERGTICTGSLLENNVVLTAAHCIGKKAEDHLILFTNDLNAVLTSQDRNLILSRIRPVIKTIVNPEWEKSENSDQPRAITQATGDTALMRFAGPVPEGFAPAKMLAPDSLNVGTQVVLAGFGVDNNVLKEVIPAEHEDFQKKLEGGEFFCFKAKVPQVQKCFQEVTSGEGRLRTTEVLVAGGLNDTEVVFDQRHGRGACKGDSGGPAYVQVNGEYHLFGVTSRGTQPGCNTYAIYSDVTTPALSVWLTDAVAQISQ